jgi:hypothetical protein
MKNLARTQALLNLFLFMFILLILTAAKASEVNTQKIIVDSISKATHGKQKHVSIDFDLSRLSNVEKSYVFAYVEKYTGVKLSAQAWFGDLTAKDLINDVASKLGEKPITDDESIMIFAHVNGYKPSKRVVNAIARAARAYNVDPLELTAIAILETGLGKKIRTLKNDNGTVDRGLFQINTVNESKCVEYNLNKPEGSALCAARLLSGLKAHRKDYLGAYHSKTPSEKHKYLKHLNRVLEYANR